MAHVLVQVLSEMTALTGEEMAAIESYFPVKTYKKGTYLLREGQIATDAYFVVKGCIRSYQLMDGEEKTLDFFTENQSAANFSSLASGKPSNQNFVCTEETTVAIINSEKEQDLYRQYPRFESFCREGMEKMVGKQHEQFSNFVKLSPEERYINLFHERPDLINRVPQYQLASYIGIQPETLSRIRKRISENK